MQFLTSGLALAAMLTLSTVDAMGTDNRRGHGLIGYGINMYQPTCAFACRDALSMSTLNCSTMADMSDMHMKRDMDMVEVETSPECFATDDAFLQTLAYCISTHCQDIPAWKLEKYWKANVAGTLAVQPDPKETYQQALSKVSAPPTVEYTAGNSLNQTMLISEDTWQSNLNADTAFEQNERHHERLGLVVFLSGVVIPIGLSLLRFIPFPSYIRSKFNAYLVHPPLYGSRHRIATGPVHIPTRGQALFIFYLVAINVILCSVDYISLQPNSFFEGTASEITAYISYRTGVLSFANIPLLILYAGRNNLLLKLTNWSHDTFLLLHKWVAWIATLEACIHSAIFLQIDLANGTHATQSKMAYWIWGVVGTLGMALLLPTSIYPVRRRVYELFLAWHILIALFVVVGCYYHILLRFENQWGYETWILVAAAVWAFDRLARAVRMLANGVRTATLTRIDDDYIRVDVAGLKPPAAAARHAYLYFPTLSWRAWENHPFSIVSLAPPAVSISDSGAAAPVEPEDEDVEKKLLTVAVASLPAADARHDEDGMTFILRTRRGTTARLRQALAWRRTTLPVLVEASYGGLGERSTSSLPSLDSSAVQSCRRLVVVAGGIGISAVLPVLQAAVAHGARRGGVQERRLFWAVRSPALAQHVQATGALQGVESQVYVKDRMDVTAILHQELRVDGGRPMKTAVLVCGPPSMADEARLAVIRLCQRSRKSDVVFLEEAFCW